MDDSLISYLLITVLGIVTILPFWNYFTKRNFDLFEPIYWASAYFFLLFVIRPIFDLTLGSVFLGEPPFDAETKDAFNLGLLYLIPSFAIFLLGYYSRVGRLIAHSLPSLPQAWSNKKLKFTLPLILIVGLFSYLLLVQSFGGWLSYSMGKQHTLTAAGQGYLLLGVSLIQIAMVVSLTHALVTGKEKILAYAVLFPLVLLMGLLSGSKGNFLSPILILLISMHYLKKRIRLKKIMVFVFIVVVSIPIFNIYRGVKGVQDIGDVGANAVASLDVKSTVRHVISRFYGIDSLTYIIRDTPNVMDYQLGGTVFPIAVAWIPRAMWEDKPIISFGKIFSETYFNEYFSGTGTSASPTILGEAYINWHIAGMLVLSFLCGIVIRAPYVYLIRRHFGGPSVFIYSQLFMYLFIFWESSIAGLIARVLALLVLWLSVAALLGRWSVRRS